MHLWSIWRYIGNEVVVTCQAKCHRCTWNLKKSQRNQNYSEILALYTRNMLKHDLVLEKSVFMPLFDSFLKDKFWLFSHNRFHFARILSKYKIKQKRTKKNTEKRLTLSSTNLFGRKVCVEKKNINK